MSGYIGNIPVPQATQTRQSFTATASQTTFNTAGYSPGYIDVFLNGVKLAPADYTATNGSDVVLAVGAASGDILETVAYEIFQVLDQDFTGDFTVDGSTFVVDSTNNSVGIGTSSPNGFLEIDGTTNDSPSMFISHDGNASIGTVFGFHSGNDFRLWNYENGVVKFGTNNAEAMRIDSSGNLLVGKTSSGSSSVGAEIFSTGMILGSVSNDMAAVLDRKNSDGEILQFRKDNSTVGSIGTGLSGGSEFGIKSNTGELQLATSYNSNTVTWDGSQLYPSSTNNLGASSARWQDLYLSGTVNSGGLTVDGGTAYHKLISTFPSTYKTNLQVGQQAHISNDAITDTLSIENTGTAGATNIQFSTAGSERMRIDSSGNVGINEQSPDRQLHITTNTSGLITSGNNRQGSVIRLTHNVNHEAGYNGGDFLGGIEFESGDSSAGGGVRTAIKTEATDPYNTHSIKFYTADSNSTNMPERMSINHRGYVTMPYQPAFHAYSGGDQTSIGEISFANTVVNIGSHYNTSTNRFTAPVAGTYKFSARIMKIATSGSSAVDFAFRRNNVGVGNNLYDTSGQVGTYSSGTINLVITLAAGDYITVYESSTTSGNKIHSNHREFTGYLIG